jgi:hypothetical protein
MTLSEALRICREPDHLPFVVSNLGLLAGKRDRA